MSWQPDIPEDWKCKTCNGFGYTVEFKTAIGIGISLEAGKHYRIDEKMTCCECMGCGVVIPPMIQGPTK